MKKLMQEFYFLLSDTLFSKRIIFKELDSGA